MRYFASHSRRGAPSQIQQILRLSEAAERHAAAAAARARIRLDEALRDLAAATALRRSHDRRQRALRALAARETALHNAFATGLNRAKLFASVRSQHATAAAQGLARLEQGLAALRASIESELKAFRSAGDALRLDVTADLAAAFRVAHGVAHLQEHYARELLARKNGELRQSEAQYAESAAVGDDEAADGWHKNSREKRAEVRRLEDKLEDLAKDKARMEQFAAMPWALLRRSAVGGAAPADAEAVRVRTSAANLAAWGGDDRSLERPEEWNRAMSDEADRAKASRLLTAA